MPKAPAPTPTTETATTTEATKTTEQIAAPAATETATTSATTPKTYTEAEYQANVKKLEKEWEKKTQAAEAKSKLSEDERTKAELEETRAALRERDARDSVVEAAGAAGVKNAKLFYNAYKSELEFDDKGKVTNLKDVLESAKAESPELFTQSPQPEGGADAGEGRNINTGGLTKEMIEKMSPKEIADNMDKIDAFFASQK